MYTGNSHKMKTKSFEADDDDMLECIKTCRRHWMLHFQPTTSAVKTLPHLLQASHFQ